MWELDHKEGWVSENRWFRTVVLDKTLESPLNNKEIEPGNSKGNQPWIFIGRTDAETEAPIFWPPDVKRQLIARDPDAGKDWRQEKGETGWDDWMASSTQWTWIWANSGRDWRTEEPGMLRPWSHKDTTDWLNYNNKGCLRYTLHELPSYDTRCLPFSLFSASHCDAFWALHNIKSGCSPHCPPRRSSLLWCCQATLPPRSPGSNSASTQTPIPMLLTYWDPKAHWRKSNKKVEDKLSLLVHLILGLG